MPAAQLASVGSAGNTVIGADSNGAPTLPGTFLGSSDIEGFQAQHVHPDARQPRRRLAAAPHDSRRRHAVRLRRRLPQRSRYSYSSPLRWFPGSSRSPRAQAAAFPSPAYALASPNSELLDLVGLALGYAEFYALTDTRNADCRRRAARARILRRRPVPGRRSARRRREHAARPRARDDARRARRPRSPAHRSGSGVLVDDVTMTGANAGARHDGRDDSVAYAMLGPAHGARSLGVQLELYSNKTPDTRGGTTPLDALALAYPSDADADVLRRVAQMLQAAGRPASTTRSPTTPGARRTAGTSRPTPSIDTRDVLDAHTAAIRGLFAAYLATGDVRYRDRAIAVFAAHAGGVLRRRRAHLRGDAGAGRQRRVHAAALRAAAERAARHVRARRGASRRRSARARCSRSGSGA